MACMISIFCAATVIGSSAQTFDTLLDFNPAIGAEPLYMQLIQGTDGNFYGTTFLDGVNGGGTVFRITSAGKLTTLYSFCAETECADGANPYAGLVQGTDGNFYGTTYSGGSGFSGTVFKVTPAGVLTTLHNFCFSPGCTDGSNPYGGVIQASNGNFYGTTYNGSTPGTIFEITPTGTLTTIYSFCSTGVCEDGTLPEAGLIQASNGNLYGTTSSGGTHSEGTVFQVTLAGALKTLYSFCSKTNCPDGNSPTSGLIQATDGNFYGTTFQGGANINYGSIFKITPAGVLTTLHSFEGTDGSGPEGALMQSTNGTFYGITNTGGTSNAGTIFSLSAGLGPFVEIRPTSGKAGSSVIILGTNLSSAASVSFNGTAATFTLVSKTEIKATVPAGATSGKVAVKISQGSLSSNVAFRVVK